MASFRAHGWSSRTFVRAAALGASVLALAHAFAACSTGDVKDAGDARPQFECSTAPILFCDPLPAGEVGCTRGAESPDLFVSRLPADRAYREGCVANFVKRDPKVEEVCGLAAVCTCVRVEDPVDGSTPEAATPDSATPDSATPDADTPDADTPDAENDAASPPLPDAAIVPDAAPATDSGAPRTGRLVWSCR